MRAAGAVMSVSVQGKLETSAPSVGGRPSGSSLGGQRSYSTRLSIPEEGQNMEWSLLLMFVWQAGRIWTGRDWRASGRPLTSSICSQMFSFQCCHSHCFLSSSLRVFCFWLLNCLFFLLVCSSFVFLVSEQTHWKFGKKTKHVDTSLCLSFIDRIVNVQSAGARKVKPEMPETCILLPGQQGSTPPDRMEAYGKTSFMFKTMKGSDCKIKTDRRLFLHVGVN